MNKKGANPNQLLLPYVYFPTTQTRQPDGSIVVRPAKPVILDDMIDLSEVCRILQMSARWAQSECERGNFKSAYQPSGREKGKWLVSRLEVLKRRGLIGDEA